SPRVAGRLPVDDDVVRHTMIDTVAVMIAGCASPAGGVIARTQEAGPSHFSCPEAVAQSLGFLGHAYDFDDSTPGMPGHPSVPVLSALFALIDDVPEATPADLVDAYLLGVEVASSLGAGM